MDTSARDTAREPRRKENTKKKAKNEKEKRDRKVKKPKLSTLAERSDAVTQRLVQADPEADGEHSAERGGLTQELILQLRALDIDDDDDDYGGGTATLTSSFYGHDTVKGGGITTVYVENEVSGEFFRVRQRQSSKTSALPHSSRSFRRLGHRRRHHAHAGSGSDSDGDERISFPCGAIQWKTFQDLDAALGILGHGIVVGLSWMDAFNWGATRDRFLHDDATRMRFVCTYSGVADRTRQLFFLLFKYPSLPTLLSEPAMDSRKLSLLGLMRKISRFSLQTPLANEDRRLERFRVRSMQLLLGAFAFTATALLVLLISSSSTLRLATAFARDPNWCDQPTSQPAAFSALNRHQQSAIANAAFLSLGWLCVCIQCSMGMSSHLSLRRRLVEAHSAIDQLETRTDQLCGKTLDGLSIDALKDLIQQHQRAIEVTESVLVTKLQAQNPTVAVG